MAVPLYRYFAQQQVNAYTNTIIGFELLLKKYQDDSWQPPRDFNQISAHIIAGQLLLTTEKLATKATSVSVNLTVDQLHRKEIRSALQTAQKRLRPTRLIVELVEAAAIKPVSLPALITMIRSFTDQGINFSLDDVGTGENLWPQIAPLLDHVQELKYALQNNHEHLTDPQARKKVLFWHDLAEKHHLRFILEGVETPEDIALADQLALDLRQGYYYGKPELIRLTPDDPQQNPPVR